MSATDEPDDFGPGYDIVMPFVVVQSEGGPYDDVAFAAGWEAAEIAGMLMQEPVDMQRPVHTRLLPQLDLIAMRWGYTMTPDEENADDEWTPVSFTKAIDKTTP